MFYFGLYLLQVNQQKRVGIVSTNNITYRNRSASPFSTNHPERLLYQTEKSRHERFSIKTPFFKILQYSRENAPNTYFE